MPEFDFSQYPAPTVIEELSYEETLAEIAADFVALFPEDEAEAAAQGVPPRAAISALMLVEGNLIPKVLQAAAYSAMRLRARINDAAKATMLPYATGSDLENLGAFYGVTRLVITPGDAEAIPPIEAVLESDTALRYRIALAPDGLSTAGPIGAYKFHTLSASGQVKDARPTQPAPGDVEVFVLSHEGNGEPSLEVLAAVEARLNDEDIRPMNDTVIVSSGVVTEYAVEATLFFYDGADVATSTAAAEAAVAVYVSETHKLGYDVTLSGLYRALHQTGIQRAEISLPAGNIENDVHEAGFCTSVTLMNGGFDE